MKVSYETVLRPLLFAFDPELIHGLSLWGFKIAHDLLALNSFVSRFSSFGNPCLRSHFHGVSFPNPVGVAAGFDKNGFLVPSIELLGVGFFEIGSVTSLPSRGNPKPRLVRIPSQEALINRMGLNNKGVDSVAKNIRNKKDAMRIPLIISIAKSNDRRVKGKKAINDYCYSFKRIHGLADLITLNVSCPNTADGKTFESPEHLDALLVAVLEARDELEETMSNEKDPLILVKIGANVDVAVLRQLIEISLSHGVKGFVFSNTYPLSSQKTRRFGLPSGGLSGRPLLKKSLRQVQHAAALVDDEKTLIIGVGGIMSPKDALKMFQRGAHLIQVFTGLVYKGPTLPQKINNLIIQICQRENLKTFREFRDFIRSSPSIGGI